MLCLDSVTEDIGNADNDKKNDHYLTKRQSSGVRHETARARHTVTLSSTQIPH